MASRWHGWVRSSGPLERRLRKFEDRWSVLDEVEATDALIRPVRGAAGTQRHQASPAWSRTAATRASLRK